MIVLCILFFFSHFYKNKTKKQTNHHLISLNHLHGVLNGSISGNFIKLAITFIDIAEILHIQAHYKIVGADCISDSPFIIVSFLRVYLSALG
jgi:hypothetical protein